MKYDSQLFGLPVVDRLSGDILGYLREVLCRPGKKKAEGIVYEERGWLKRCRFVPWAAVTAVGEKSVVIDSAQKGKPPRRAACEKRDSKVFNSDGSYAGRVSNYLIDENNGAVLGMELSASIVDDLKFGRKIIENKGNIMKGEDFLMLADSFEEGCTELNERRSEDERLY